MTSTPDTELADLVAKAKAELQRDLAEGLRRGGAAIASQVNDVLATTNTRLSRLEQQRTALPKKR